MNDTREKIQVRVDGYTRVCLTVIAVLLAVLIVGLWADGDRWVDRASAQSDGGSEQAQAQAKLLEAQEKTTAAIQNMTAVLTSGKVKVLVMKHVPESKDKK